MEEYLAVFDDTGRPTGAGVPRSLAHSSGVLHGASHILVCKREGGQLYVLLQRRSEQKDSYPGLLDISSAGHIEQGSDFLETAQKELFEELGITAHPNELVELLTRQIARDEIFHGKPFCDREFNRIYLLDKAVDSGHLRLQASEVSEVVWMAADEALTRLAQSDPELCMDPEAFRLAIAATRKYYGEALS